MINHAILTEVEIQSFTTQNTDWTVVEGKLEATFTLPDFSTAIRFINQIAELAETMQHHPEFTCAYRTVSFSYCTHDVGNKITDTDTEMAGKISELAKILKG